jgi:hypothetical protein
MILRILRRNVTAEMRAVEMESSLSLSDLSDGSYYWVSERPNRLIPRCGTACLR